MRDTREESDYHGQRYAACQKDKRELGYVKAVHKERKDVPNQRDVRAARKKQTLL